MPSIDFFSCKDDQIDLLNFIFSKTPFRVYESYSSFDNDLCRFFNTDEIEDKYSLGFDRNGNGTNVLLQLWDPNSVKDIEIKKISLNPSTGHSFRFSIQGFGLVQLYFGGVFHEFISLSHFGTFSEKGAIRHGYSSGVDWKRLFSEFNKIANYLKRSSKAKAGTRILLKHAHDFGVLGSLPKSQPLLVYKWDPNANLYSLKKKCV